MSPWDPLREEIVAIWAVLSTLVQDVARLREAVFGPDQPQQDVDD